jgi:dUTP pyrophosphatase
MSPSTLKFVRLSEHVGAPFKGSERAAGFDLTSAYDYVVPARGMQLVKTDLQIELPAGCYGRVAPRSGLAVKHGIDVGAGVIDEDYRGNVGVVLFNHSDEDFRVNEGDRVAQLICQKIFYPQLEEAETLTDTKRGREGFGSTGVQVKRVKLEQ